ncbi:MAG: dTDP-4-dehydrorhamnose reductase [Actinomycetota bacterium]|nr:dTDP-4-dehydrorhamnose reductase [Actinomycetota bacterium]
MLGHRVVDAARAAGHDVVGLERATLDVTDEEAVRARMAAERPVAVINCAAWTDVDGAQEHVREALDVNADAAGHIARAAAEQGARIVHVSTDYVFDGAKGSPWLESDPVGPLQSYGASKLGGEYAVAAGNPDHAVVRSAWLFGPGGANFVDTMLRLGSERDEVAVVTDQVGSPTWTGHLAPALVALAEARATGTFHVAGSGACSWHQLCVEAFRLAGVYCTVTETTSAAFPRPAPRPAYSVLGTERGAAPRLPPWQEGLAAHLKERVVA